MYSRSRRERKRASDDGGCAEAEPLDQPLLVIGLLEGAQGLLQVLDIRDVPHPQQLFLEGAEEPFDATVAFRLADEGRRRHDAEEPHLGLKVVAHVLTAVVVAHREPGRRASGHPPVPLAAFARGTHAGNCLHELLEHWDFQEDSTALVDRALQRHRLHSEDAVGAVRHTLDDLKTTRLDSLDASLETAAADRGLSEWEFLLPLGRAGITGQALSNIFARHARNDDERDYALDRMPDRASYVAQDTSYTDVGNLVRPRPFEH